MQKLEVFFDCSSPWTYLCFESLQQMLTRQQVQVIYRPILVGGLFNTINPSVYENRANPVPVKARYYNKDLQDWANFVGITIGIPPVFPVNSVKAMRGALLAVRQGFLETYARAMFQAYWGHLQDISQDTVLADVLRGIDVEPVAFLAAAATPEIKQQLRDNTEELAKRGGFGSPTLFLNHDDMYFGNDRLTLIEAKLATN